ncbi:hypothetical protein C5C67_06760 [Rathayibacter sp. AY1E1]|nr:hypothetical protein C5C67_06760 [Rathayibacter sp. AY1E1]
MPSSGHATLPREVLQSEASSDSVLGRAGRSSAGWSESTATVGAGLAVPGTAAKRVSSIAYSKEVGERSAESPACAWAETSASAYGRAKRSFGTDCSRSSQSRADSGAALPRMRIEARMRGSTPIVTPFPATASSCRVRVPVPSV